MKGEHCCWFLASVRKDGAMEVDETMVRTMNGGREWCRCKLLQLVRRSRWCDDGGAVQIRVEMESSADSQRWALLRWL